MEGLASLSTADDSLFDTSADNFRDRSGGFYVRPSLIGELVIGSTGTVTAGLVSFPDSVPYLSTQTRMRHTIRGSTATTFQTLMYYNFSFALSWLTRSFSSGEVSGDDITRWMYSYLNEYNLNLYLQLKKTLLKIGSAEVLAEQALANHKNGADELLFVRAISILEDWEPAPISAVTHLVFNVEGREFDLFAHLLSQEGRFGTEQVRRWFAHLASYGSAQVKMCLLDYLADLTILVRNEILEILVRDSEVEVAQRARSLR